MTFQSDWCAFVIMYEISSGKMIMVVDADKPDPKLKKFAGGTHDPGDWDSVHTALREVKAEVPQIEFLSDLVPVVEYDLGDHTKYFYFAKVKQVGELEAVSEEIYEIYKFSPTEIEEMIESGEVVKDHGKAWLEFERQMATA